MTTLPKTVPPLPRKHSYARDVATGAAFDWLRAGWSDLKIHTGYSLLYGLAVFVASIVVVGSLFFFGLDYILFPALAGFMVVGPLLAIGLYEKSRRIAAGEPITLASMIFVRPKSGGQVLFTGALLCLLMLFWMRSAILLYALFFGLLPFPGLDDLLPTLFGTTVGLSLLIVGTLVGGLFAAFSLAISAFSVPMMLSEKVDAFTAMGNSTALVWHNLPVMLVWGALVLGLTVLGILTGFLGLIVVFPLLGHGTWHAYRAMRSA